MAFSPNGDLVVVDSDECAVSVLDREGAEVARWGAEGEGPGEVRTKPVSVAVSDKGVVAVRSLRGVDLFTLGGEYMRSHSVDIPLQEVAFDAQGGIVAGANPSLGLAALIGEEVVHEQVIRVPDGDVLWTAPRPGPPSMTFQFGRLHMVLSNVGHGRVAIGMSDEYDLTVLDALSAREVGRLKRDVAVRGPSEAFNDAIRARSSNANSMGYADPFPVVRSALAGPSAAIWVRRGIGVGDALAPPVGDGNWSLVLYDLFDGEHYEYMGTIEVPEGLRLMAGDSDRVAGVQRDELGTHSVRVLRVAVGGPPVS